MIPKEAIPKNRDPKLMAILEEIWSGPMGPCIKVNECAWRSRACTLTYNEGMFLPAKRYLLCHAWTKYKGKPIREE